MRVKNFELIVYILSKEKNVIKLIKRERLEIKKDKKGRDEVREKVVFEKDGKSYRILVVIFLEEYLLGMRTVIVESKFFSPADADYQIYKGYMGEPNNSPEKDRERQDEGAVLVDEWNKGRITFLLLFIIIIVVVVVWNWKKKKKQINPNSNILFLKNEFAPSRKNPPFAAGYSNNWDYKVWIIG
ncbi:MAG: hypothetical protein MRERV_5c007 [Mycoplasmataceae bacterium RV_VA103A]|nr:MAG: hypothetical protein MRERV_5c007 [Mycoplasmataceae bacterium RV_VA103A]